MPRIADNFNLFAPPSARPLADNLNIAGTGTVVLPPTGLMLDSLDAGAHAAWTAPLGTVDGYRVVATTVAGSKRSYTIPADVTSVCLFGLINDTAWTIAVQARAGDTLSDSIEGLVTPAVATP